MDTYKITIAKNDYRGINTLRVVIDDSIIIRFIIMSIQISYLFKIDIVRLSLNQN